MADPHHTSSRPGTPVLVLTACGVIGALLVTAATLAIFLPARDRPAAVREVEAPQAEPAEVPASTVPTIADEAESVAFHLSASSSGWAAHITGVEVITVLRRPVIEVATGIGPEQAGLSDEFSSALSAFVGGLTAENGSPYTYYLRIHSSEGDVIGAVARTDDRWALDTPPIPTDPAALRSWLDSVYGPASPQPEAWFARITDVRADADGAVVVRTDLDPGSIEDQQVAQTIIDAVNSSGATFAPGVRVLFGDGVFEWSALLTGIDPYGP